jgi:hypothetical protein
MDSRLPAGDDRGMRGRTFLSPMFDERVSVRGVDVSVILLGIAVAGCVVGLVWLRRILTIEPESRSFRATAGSPPWRSRLLAAAIAAVALLILLVIAILALRSVEE